MTELALYNTVTVYCCNHINYESVFKISELKREIESLRSDIPNKRNIEDELTTVQIQLEQCRELMVDLEAQLELPSSENARLLEGVDLSTEEMTRKIEEVQRY